MTQRCSVGLEGPKLKDATTYLFLVAEIEWALLSSNQANRLLRWSVRFHICPTTYQFRLGDYSSFEVLRQMIPNT